jgi:hypothetical protein
LVAAVSRQVPVESTLAHAVDFPEIDLPALRKVDLGKVDEQSRWM